MKKLTDRGFANLQQVEASYDAIRKMTNAFSKPHHGLNLTSRTLFNAPNRAQLIENVEKELKSLSNGESLTFNSGYGAFASSMVLPGSQTLNVTGARVNADRGYSLAFTRGEDGLTVTVGRNGSGGIAPFTALGYNVLTGHVDPNDVSFGKTTATPLRRWSGWASRRPRICNVRRRTALPSAGRERAEQLQPPGQRPDRSAGAAGSRQRP